MDFEMIGKLKMPKETEKFHPYEETTYPSGWAKRKLMFNVVCGDNVHLLTVDGGCFTDGHGDVYLYSKNTVDENGNKIKGEQFTIPFKDRLTSKRLAEVAEFKKFIIDLEKPNRRYQLEKAAEKMRQGTSLTDEELKQMELENESEVAEALEKSKKKRHEFVTEWDFAEFIKKVIDSGKYANKKFFIRGTGAYQYSDEKERVYSSYVPTRIYLQDDDVVEKSEGTIKILYNAGSLDGMSVEEKGKYYVNGYMMEYNRNRKANIPIPVTIAIPVPPEDADEKAKKKLEAIKNKFTVDDDSWKEYGVVVNMLNGSQKMQITEDMLTEEQKDDLDCGLITMEDIIADKGGNVYGERIQEYQFVKPARGFTNGRNDTAYTDEDMTIKPLVNEAEEAIEDIFDDDDDL